MLIKLIIIFYFILIKFVNSQLKCNENIPNLNKNLPIVCTENGWVKGYKGINFKEITFFKGIPYASPPINEFRWKEPQKVNNWNNILDCSNYGSQCPQPIGNATNLLNNNIIKPSLLLPVYVWIHPGAFTGGSSSDPTFDGEYLSSKGIVYVSINYRIGALGFMANKLLREDNPKNISGNYGLLDQIYALNWIKRNIEEFGGDSNKITIGGQSAGAASVYLLSLSPLASNLFKGVISESGGVMYPRDPQSMYSWHYTVEEAEQKSEQFLSKKI
ncbi:Carboxylic ester hydrolase [Meloidogyne graminicola]|uniref:Carboxylic ester hydrolase n=1 Tax=Meloidogyne graminicola TaxID=189291 RepID=A0A8S9ZR89_9BILA|nr:Carboxylic ester hydrolase [Meloidogyne graminicola]